MRTRHIVAIVIGCLLILPGVGLLFGGGAVGVAALAARGNDGWMAVDMNRLESSGVAVTADDIMLRVEGPAAVVNWFGLQARVTARSLDGKPVFVGVAPQDSVGGYLAGAAYDRVLTVDRYGVASYSHAAGSGSVAPPTSQGFWERSVSGVATQDLTWTIQTGQWAVAVMNADGSPGVAVAATAGVRVGSIWAVALGLAGAGLVLVGLGAALVIVGARGRQQQQPPPPRGPYAGTPVGLGAGQPAPPPTGQPIGQSDAPPPSGPPVGPPVAPPTGVPVGEPVPAGTAPPVPPDQVRPTVEDPVRLDADLQPDLSRWLWLVKWFAAIPHLIVLTALWAAFGVLTVVAWFAILFTGRYPRGIFDFNVGVLRWTWRVSYYAFSGGLGTDEYPPFSLDGRPGDRATLDIAYPEHLSRGLIFVKWLLLLPHWIFMAIVVGTTTTWTRVSEATQTTTEYQWPGLLGLLVALAAVILLFTGSYPRPIFDLVIGLNRWTYRVAAYGALMTDVYPPFRLDQGGHAPVTTLRARTT
ncbi:MAG TPA: DUF4389 domain-containing protein [Intrasporangium sp.]|nr:DUF4389 domain-containing protein [Intrasporangium sp.]